jgi:hypothetical protein
MATCGKVLVKILQNYGIDTASYLRRAIWVESQNVWVIIPVSISII